MYWNFGGNFQSVATVCQCSEWSKCLISFVEYIWFEVVTDVADCLANEEVLWTVSESFIKHCQCTEPFNDLFKLKILAVVLIFLMIAYLAYWKLQWARETKRNTDKLRAINYKIEDIELKLDIITYKTQYGSWTSQCLQEKNILANAKNYQFDLSKITLEKSWIKNILARASKEKYGTYNLQGNQLKNCDKPKLSLADSDNKLLSYMEKDDPFDYNSTCRKNIEGHSGLLFQSVDNSRSYSLIVPPESNLNERSKNHILYLKDFEASNSHLSRRKSISLGKSALKQKKIACNNDLKVTASSKNMTEFSRASVAEFQGKNVNASSKTDHSLSKSQGTLFDVQQKLTTLYRTIHGYNVKNSIVPMLTLDSDSNSIQISGTGTCDVDECTGGTSPFEDSNGYEQDINETQCVGEYSNYTTTNTNETTALSAMGMKNYFNRAICDNAGNSLNCTLQNDKITANSDAEKDETDTNSQLELHSALAIDAENILEYETLIEASEGLNILKDPISASVQDASKLKKQILSKVEIQNSGIDDKEEYALSGSETSSDSSLKRDNMKFESSILEIIIEEPSLSSCTEMKSDVHCWEIEEKNTFSQDKTLVPNEESKRTRSKIDQFSHEKVKKQKEGNCVSNTESSNIRKFPSTFSSIFLLCNDQDTNHCQSVHDDSAIHDTKSSQDLISLNESSSDVSVSKSINELIDNERKSKSPDQSLEAEKIGGSTRNFEVSEEVKVPYSAIDSTNGTVISHNTVNNNQTKREPSLDEAAKYTGVECLKEIKNVAKKLIDSVIDMKYKADPDRSEIQSNNGVSSKLSEIKFKSYEINDAIETRDIDSIISKYDSLSDSFATRKCMEWNSGKMKRYDTLHRLKETDNTLGSCGCNNVQRTATINLDYNNRKLSKAKSYSDLTTLNERQLQLIQRRSRSHVNSGVITDERDYNTEKDYFFEPSSSSNNKLPDAEPLNNSISDDLKDEMNSKKSKSCGSLCSKSPSNSIRISTSVKERPIVDTMTINSSKRSYSINDSCCELISCLSHPSSQSCIPLTKHKGTSQKNEQTFLANSTDSSTNFLLGNETQDLTCQVVADVHERCSSSNDTENTDFQEYMNSSEFEKLKNFEKNAIEYYNLISDNRRISNCLKQKNLANTKVEEQNVPNKVVCSQENNTLLNSPEAINRSITCLLPDELSEQNPLNSLVFQNAIPSISPDKIEKKETEVLVKPSTLDMSTSMTNFPSTYHLEERHNLSDVKIFEVSDELTKEECIRYLQMFDQDSNHDQSTNTYDINDQILENI